MGHVRRYTLAEMFDSSIILLRMKIEDILVTIFTSVNIIVKAAGLNIFIVLNKLPLSLKETFNLETAA